jgi:hypothetical protein
MMSTMSHYRPSKRPKVSQVDQWDLLFTDSITDHWRGNSFDGAVEVYNGYPFPDFYKVVWYPKYGSKEQKLFYGETAWMDAERYVSDLGFRNVHGSL